MRGIQLTGYKNLEFVETDMPIPREGEVLIKMSRASICGSDLRTYDRVHGEEMYPFGLGAPCHECLGEVVESYSESLSPGDKVIVLPRKTGGLMEYVAESSSRCIKLPGDGDLSVWMMAQPVGTVMYALQRVGSVLGKRVAVLSQGPIGLAFTQLLVAAGAAQVIVTDILDYRLEAAKKLGATHWINPEQDDVVKTIEEITKGQMVDIAIEACGRPETCNQVFGAIRLQGTAVLFGMTHDEDIFPFDYNAMYLKIPTILVTNSARADANIQAISECVELMEQGRLDLSHLVTHRLPIEQVQDAYDIYSEKRDYSLKTVMEF